MALFDLPFESIDIKALLDLMENEVRESIVLDYKRDLPGKSDEDKKEFLRDVTAFANAEGGDIIFGMAEEDGVANDLVGLEANGLDAEMLRLNNLLRDCVDPRIHGLNMKPIAMENGRQVLHIRIPKSLEAPHLVQLGNHKQFWMRNPSGKHPMSSSEVKAIVMRTQDWKQRAEAWREERIKLVEQNDGPVLMEAGPHLHVHFLPLPTAEKTSVLESELVRQQLLRIVPDGVLGWNHRMTFDGFLVAREMPGSSNENYWYWLWYHDGRTEFGMVLHPYQNPHAQEPSISGEKIEKRIHEALNGFLNARHMAKTQGPFLMLISITGLAGLSLSSRDPSMDLFTKPLFDRNAYLIPELFSEDTPPDLWKFLAPAINRLWQAAGRDKSPYLNPDGTRVQM